MCELELPYRLRNMGRTRAGDFIPPRVRRTLLPLYKHEGRNRRALKERTGTVQVPYLYDPNTDPKRIRNTLPFEILSEFV